MIVDFTVENYGPFRDETKLSLQGTAGKEHPENVCEAVGIRGGLLTAAAVFGPNASGKSKLFDAMLALQQLVRQPAPANTPIAVYFPFLLSPQNKDAPVSMTLTFVSEEVLFRYAVLFDSQKILQESLHYYPKGQRHLIFQRTGNVYRFGNGVAAGQRAISKMTGPNSAYLAVAAQFSNRLCLQAHNEIVNKVAIFKGDLSGQIDTAIARMNGSEAFKEQLVRMLAAADLGIEDLNGTVKTEEPPAAALFVKHRLSTAGVTEADRTFPIEFESQGTVRMFCLAGPLAEALQNGSMVVIDDFGAFLHHDLCRWIIGQFGTSTNKKGAQLIVSSHDLLLIDTAELLRRDQIYLTERDSGSGSASLYCLSDFRIRKDLDVRKAYEAGRFGAFPCIGGGRRP